MAFHDAETPEDIPDYHQGDIDDDDERGPFELESDDVDDAYKHAASRARSNDFTDTGGKDWT